MHKFIDTWIYFSLKDFRDAFIDNNDSNKRSLISFEIDSEFKTLTYKPNSIILFKRTSQKSALSDQSGRIRKKYITLNLLLNHNISCFLLHCLVL